VIAKYGWWVGESKPCNPEDGRSWSRSRKYGGSFGGSRDWGLSSSRNKDEREGRVACISIVTRAVSVTSLIRVILPRVILTLSVKACICTIKTEGVLHFGVAATSLYKSQ